MDSNPAAFLLSEFSSSTIYVIDRGVVYKRNEIVRQEGSKDGSLYIIESGCIIATECVDGEELVIRFGYEGDVIVAMGSFLTEAPSNLVFKALRSTTVSIIKKNDFLAFVSESKDRLNAWLGLQNRMIVDLMEREKDLMMTNPRDRYNRVLDRSPKLFQEVPLKYIASYLRMTQETLTRLRS